MATDLPDFSGLFDGYLARGGAGPAQDDRQIILPSEGGDSITERFVNFDRLHPEVWDYFCGFAFELIRAGHRHNSADAVLHRVRWETAVAGGLGSGESFKINNNYSAYYARKFHEAFPEYDGFFRTRRSRADSAPEGDGCEPEAPAP